MSRLPFACLPLLLAFPAIALAQTANLSDCASIADKDERLSCFDRLAASTGSAGMAVNVAAAAAAPTPAPASTAAGVQAPVLAPGIDALAGATALTPLMQAWELGNAPKRGRFTLTPYRSNYLIAAYTHSPNDAPYLPFRTLLREEGLSHAELAYQLSFKMKLIEDAFDKPVDLWFGYTQHSFWQAANHQASSPFRETNYQPELMAVVPLHLNLLGVDARFLNLGFVHQSNGQSSTLSRSWNRVYAQVGVERGNLAVLGRVWKRLNESRADDDNPDIIDYMGRGDISATYRWEGHEFMALTRYNFSTNKGGIQLGWAFPLVSRLKGYVQGFSGYGQSLIDYNYNQKSVGLGVMVGY